MKAPQFRCVVGLLLALTFAGTLWAQFPKLPKIVKKLPGQSDSKSTESKGPKGPVPEITSVSPKDAPPEGSGELVLTGKNFVDGMGIRMSCKDSVSPHIDSVKVESAERAVAHVTFPEDVPEGPCEVYVDYVLGKDNEILPSREGTPEVVQMKGVSFGVSGASTSLPVSLGDFGLVPEEELRARLAVGDKAMDMEKLSEDIKSGKVNPMDPEFMKKMQEASLAMSKMVQQGGIAQQKRTKGALILKSGSVSFVADGKPVFTESVGSVKEVAEVKDPMGQAQKLFKIAFSDGKTYGFQQDHSGSLNLDRIKKRLGK